MTETWLYTLPGHFSKLYHLPEQVKSYEKIYICGAALAGQFIFDFLQGHNLSDKVECFLVTNREWIPDEPVRDLEVKHIDDVTINDNDLMLLAAGKDARAPMLEKCAELNIKNFIEITFFDRGGLIKIDPDNPPPSYKETIKNLNSIAC